MKKYNIILLICIIILSMVLGGFIAGSYCYNKLSAVVDEAVMQAELEFVKQVEVEVKTVEVVEYSPATEVIGEITIDELRELGIFQQVAGMMAQTTIAEIGSGNTYEISEVDWSILNRANVIEDLPAIISSPHQFAYCATNPIDTRHYAIAIDVLTRWYAHQYGMLLADSEYGRTLPAEFTYFGGGHDSFNGQPNDGRKHNWFRTMYNYNDAECVVYSEWLTSPYKENVYD